jgi:signal transduction histidine kinase
VFGERIGPPSSNVHPDSPGTKNAFRSSPDVEVAAMQVLVADDSRLVRNQIAQILNGAGYSVELCSEGLSALERLMKGDLRLAILDWNMPGIDGVDICKRLQQEHQLQAVYTIIVTAQESDESLAAAFKAGASDYISKPFSPTELLARVHAGQRITELQSRLTQSQKLESIGQLAAGVAHEINTPIQYIGDNLRFLQDAIDQICQVIPADQRTGEIEFLLTEVPLSISQSLEGVDRVGSIVRAMKDFAHPGTNEKLPYDIHRTIDNTVTVAANEWKYVAHIVKDYDRSLPEVPCLPGELNQVLLNLIVNSAHAIAEVPRPTGEKGTITLRTRRDGNQAIIEVSDNGCGIKPEYRDRVFDPFFTSKGVGKGTGQGLTIVHNVIVGMHGGTIDFTTMVGKGTTFRMSLPLDSSEHSLAHPSTQLAETGA